MNINKILIERQFLKKPDYQYLEIRPEQSESIIGPLNDTLKFKPINIQKKFYINTKISHNTIDPR